MVVSTSPGKIIVTGEYVGIFGEPVTLTSVDLETKVSIEDVTGNDVTITSDRYPEEKVVVGLDRLEQLHNEALREYQKYLVNLDVNLLKKYRGTKLMPATLAVASAVSYLKKRDKARGFNVVIRSILPVGSGLGSSASMSAAVIGAVLSNFQQCPDLSNLNMLTYGVEQVLNGKPSGADNSAVVYGGWLRYQRENGKMNITQLSGMGETRNWWLVDGGRPSETTLDLIAKVLELKKMNTKKVDELIKRDRAVTEHVQSQIREGILKPDFLAESQLVLEEFGVIGERGKDLIKQLGLNGGYAKVSGAGGISSGVGTILCYHEDEEKLKRIAFEKGFRYSPVVLGGPGWRIEK
jgi:mevalonate kinase